MLEYEQKISFAQRRESKDCKEALCVDTMRSSSVLFKFKTMRTEPGILRDVNIHFGVLKQIMRCADKARENANERFSLVVMMF